MTQQQRYNVKTYRMLFVLNNSIEKSYECWPVTTICLRFKSCCIKLLKNVIEKSILESAMNKLDKLDLINE